MYNSEECSLYNRNISFRNAQNIFLILKTRGFRSSRSMPPCLKTVVIFLNKRSDEKRLVRMLKFNIKLFYVAEVLM